MNAPDLKAHVPKSALNFWTLLWNEIQTDQILLRAAALSYQSLAYMVPIMAVLLAVLSGPVFQEKRDQVIDGLMRSMAPDPFDDGAYSGFADDETKSTDKERQNMVQQIKSAFQEAVAVLGRNMAKISVVSFLSLLFIAGRMFKTIEDCFNIIWRVELGRSLFMKAALTTALVFWGPVFIALSVTFTEKISDWPMINRYVVPWLMTGIGFTAFYMIMPHLKVNFRAAVIGGFAGAFLWELSKWGFLLYCTHALGGAYKIYGTLGLVPVVFLWVDISWVVILVGAEITYVLQYRRSVEERWEQRQAELIARNNKHTLEDIAFANASLLPYVVMATAIETAHQFRAGKVDGGVRKADLCAALDVEPSLFDRAITRLVGSGVLVIVADSQKNLTDDPRYLPGRDLSLIDLAKLAEVSKGPLPALKQGMAWQKAAEILHRFEREGDGPLSHETLAQLFATESNIKEASMNEGEKPALA